MDLAPSHRDDLRLVRDTWVRVPLGVLLALALCLPGLAPDAWVVLGTTVCLYAVGVLGQNLLIGYTGQFSFGQAGFLAAGAYAFAHLRAAGVPFPLALLGAGLLAALLGLLLGFPSLRLKGPYLAIATLGFGVAAYQLLASSNVLSGGRTGLPVPALAFPSWVSPTTGLYYVDLILLLLFITATANLVSSYVGRAFVAIRDSDLAAEAMGVNPTRYKLLAFAVSSFYTGVHGALFAQFLGHLEPQNFTLAESVTLVVAVIVGGLASVEGSILGAAFVVLIPAFGIDAAWFVPVSFGSALVLVLLFEPAGLAGRLRRIQLYFESWPFR